MADVDDTTRTLSTGPHPTPIRKRISPQYRKEPFRIEEDPFSSENTIRDENAVNLINEGPSSGDVSIKPSKRSSKSKASVTNKKELAHSNQDGISIIKDAKPRNVTFRNTYTKRIAAPIMKKIVNTNKIGLVSKSGKKKISKKPSNFGGLKSVIFF
jgi:hypothetical protein